MLKKCVTVFGLVILLTAIPAAIVAQDAKTVLDSAAKALGAENLRTIQYSGAGSNFAFGQSVNPNAPWPRFVVKSYSREIDFNAPASRVQLTRTGGDARGGGGLPLTTDQNQNQVIAPGAPWAQQVDIWLLPQGFIKKAMISNPTVKSQTVGGKKYNVVTFTAENKYSVNGYINDQNMVEKVVTSLPNDVLGDMPVEATYADYKDFGGVKFPTKIIQKQGGYPVLDLAVSDVKPNATVNIQPPQNPAGPPAVTVTTEKVADGVFYLMGGSHHSIVVEFKDYIAVIEGPQNEARSLAVIAETKKLIPNKPIKYLINTHHHFDHSGGIRTFVDEGATIITQQMNKPYYEKTFAMARTLAPDKLAQSKKKANFETVADKKVLSDGSRTLELHLIKSNVHNDGILMAYLPKEKILVEADLYTPPAANAPPLTSNPNLVSLVDNIQRLRLDVDKILPLHGPGVSTRADLFKIVGRASSN